MDHIPGTFVKTFKKENTVSSATPSIYVLWRVSYFVTYTYSGILPSLPFKKGLKLTLTFSLCSFNKEFAKHILLQQGFTILNPSRMIKNGSSWPSSASAKLLQAWWCTWWCPAWDISTSGDGYTTLTPKKKPKHRKMNVNKTRALLHPFSEVPRPFLWDSKPQTLCHCGWIAAWP